MTVLEIVSNDPVELYPVSNDAMSLESTATPVDTVVSVNGKQGVVTLDADDLKAVSYEAQTLTDTQKAQARTNIDVPDSADDLKAVSYEAQTLTDTQKAQARTNIDVPSTTELNLKADKTNTYTKTEVDGAIEDATENLVSETELTEALYDKADVILTSASGTIASFSDGANMPVKSLEVEINAVQSVSGDPSPTNIRPISGWDAVNVVRCGVNVWDEEWEVGTINASTGENQSSTTRIRSKNLIPILPNTNYCYTQFQTGGNLSTGRVCYYDKDKNYISGNAVFPSGTAGFRSPYVFTTPSNAYFMRFSPTSEYGTTYNQDISINYPSTDTEYHSYNGTTYPISLGQTVYGGVLDVTSGVLTINKTIVDLGTLNWTWNNGGWFQTVISDMKYVSVNTEIWNAIAEKYKIRKAQGMSTAPNYEFAIDTSNMKVKMPDNSEEPSGQLVYELATPQTITLTPTEVTTLLGDNNIWADSGDVAVIYRADTKAYIDGTIVDVPLAMIAPIENGTKSSKAYAVGEYFILDGNKFCKAKTSIASGATFTLNTNYTITTIGAELKALQ